MRSGEIILSIVLLCIPGTASASDLRQIGMVNLPGAPGFGQLAFANGVLLLAHPGAAAVDVFSPTLRRDVAEIVGLTSPRAITVDEQAGKVYIADHGSKSIVVVSTDGWKVIGSIPLPSPPDALLLEGAGKLYWTDAEDGAIALLDLHTRQTIGTVDIGGPARNLAFDPARHLVFATVQDLHQIVALDSQLRIVDRFNLQGSQPTGLAYDPQYGELYVAVRGAVLAIRADTGAEIDRVQAPEGVDALWLDPSSHTLYAASEGSLLVMSAKGKLTAVETITPEVKGHTVAFDAAEHLVLLPGGREGKSKLLILQPVNAAQAGAAETRDARAR
ncbi:MAG TPA: hypothetical protein VKV05_03625 [Terriglobales bacterium]|nr:hypothetical protein [Terriglobales bacterium]